ncbi:ninein isoform X6 [Ambystoma mexicanum]|uniref:ninein isoform X6 n=1 Tax=Ambystoma mexicanum TaxID=8296 RepID=UPI0037E8EB8D
MDEAEQDQYEARLKELFDSFDSTGTGSLGQEELTDLCHMLQLEEVAPTLQQALLQGNLLGRVHFDQFKEALILILSNTLSNEESFQEPDSSPEAQPKYIKDGKRYGRRSVPELHDSLEDLAVTVLEPDDEEEPLTSHIISEDCDEHWKTQDREEYEAEGQLRFWNPDDLNSSQHGSSQDWIEAKLQLICEDLGISRDGLLKKKKLFSICEQYGFQNLDKETMEDAFQNLSQDDTMSLQDFFYAVFKNGCPPTPSASTPYRQLKRHLSIQSFDESGRRTITPSGMISMIGFRLFSCLDDGSGYGSAEEILDNWHEEGIENSHAVLEALDFGMDGKINLTELTMALENELLITKNEIHRAVLASFKSEIRHLLGRTDQGTREIEKLRSDLDKNEKLKTLLASEVDDHHAAIEQQHEHNLRKVEEDYKERTAALKSELGKERDQILQHANKQRSDLEKEVEKLKRDESFSRDRLTLSLKENSRLERELLENAKKLIESENLTDKLQKNLDNLLKEKFGDLDPSSAEFLLQEERLAQIKNEYERQCRELQDRIDELQSELEYYRIQGVRVIRPSLKSSLSEEIDSKSGGVESDQGLGSEDCHPLNMSIEAELAIEQMKDEHQKELDQLKQELDDTVNHYQKRLEENKSIFESEQEEARQKFNKEICNLEEQISALKEHILDLEGEITRLGEEQRRVESSYLDERKSLQVQFEEEKAHLQDRLKQEQEEALASQRDYARACFDKEREDLVQHNAQMEQAMQEKMNTLLRTFEDDKRELEVNFHEQLARLGEQHEVAQDDLRRELLEKHQLELQEERCETEELKEENSVLKKELANSKEETSIYNQRLKELYSSQEEMWENIETVKKEKLAVQKMVEHLKKQVSELKVRNQQLESENNEVCQKNSKNLADIQDLNRQLNAGILRHKGRKGAGKEWERERSKLKEELENHKTQLSRCSDLQSEVSSAVSKNEKLQKEKEALNEELNRCVEKAAKVPFLETTIASLKHDQKSWLQESQTLKSQLAVSQEKNCKLDETLQGLNLQISRIKSDLRVTLQENEALKQDVMSLHKLLQNANDKIQILEKAVQATGLQNQQKKIYWDDLADLMTQEQQLLRQENERLQKEVHSTKLELTQCRDKVQQLETNVLSLKHHNHQSHSSMVRALEQEKLTLKRECEQLKKEYSSANRKISRMNSLERELETVKMENEGFRKKQIKLDDQLMEMLHSGSTVTLSQSQQSRERQHLQQQACTMVPREQFLQLQQQLLQAERRSQQLHEELEHRPSENNTPQGGHELLLRKMEQRMLDVEQKLRIVKLLLQEKVNQLHEQVSKNSKANGVIKDLYVENAQLLKALDVNEQRNQTSEKKNYLLEEKIAGLTKIVRELAPSSLNGMTTHHLRS